MNGARKKVAAGFKLESLYKVGASRLIVHAPTGFKAPLLGYPEMTC